MRIFRVSGVRLDINSHLHAAQFAVICDQAEKLGTEILEEARKEPHLFYDYLKNLAARPLVASILSRGELFFAEIDGKIIAYAAFRDILIGHKAKLEIYLLPQYRKTRTLGEFRDALAQAAFAPFPDGLQLIKISACVHPQNIPSLKACKNSGFVHLSNLPYEGLFKGQLVPMIYLELYPPEIRHLMKPQEISNVKRSVSPNPSSPPIPAAAAIPTGALDKQLVESVQSGAVNISGAEHPTVSNTSPARTKRNRVREQAAPKSKHVQPIRTEPAHSERGNELREFIQPDILAASNSG